MSPVSVRNKAYKHTSDWPCQRLTVDILNVQGQRDRQMVRNGRVRIKQ